MASPEDTRYLLPNTGLCLAREQPVPGVADQVLYHRSVDTPATRLPEVDGVEEHYLVLCP